MSNKEIIDFTPPDGSIADTDSFLKQSSGGTTASVLWSTIKGELFILPSFTTGSIPFSNGTTLLEDNANFVWDDTNNRLGLGTNFPEARLSVVTGTLNTSAIFLPLATGGANGSYTAITGKYAVGNNFCRSDIRFGAENIGTGTGFLAFATGTNTTTERARIDSLGNLLIGNTSRLLFTDKELNINADSGSVGLALATGGVSRFYMTGTSTEGNITTVGVIPMLFGTNQIERMRIDGSGNVAIGSSAPSTKLDVVGANNDSIQYRTSTRAIGIGVIGGLSSIYAGSGTEIVFNIGGERARFTSNGIFGVGTTNPLGLASSLASNSATILSTTGTYQQLELTGAGANEALRLSLGVTTSIISGHQAGTGVIQSLVNASHFTNILLNPSGGNVGIRMPTVAPTAYLHIGAGTATANTAPLKFTAGTALTTPEAGTFEFSNSETGLTFTAVATRRQVVLDTATQTLTNKTLTTPVLNGTPTGTGVATSANVNTLALRDANGNLNFNNWVGGYTSTVSSAGTTVLTVGSSYEQRTSGTTTHTYTLPVATTLAVGHTFLFINDSTGSVTINSSGANLVYTLPAGGRVFITCILNSGTTAASWTTAVIGGSGGSSAPRQIRITIPGELVADTAGYQGFFWYNDTGSSITVSNVAVAVAKAGTTCSVNLYKSSGTPADGLDTNAVNLFTSAIALGSGYTSLTNVPNTTTVEAGRWVTGRVTAVAGAPAHMQIILTY